MQHIRNKSGYNIPFDHLPSAQLEKGPRPNLVGLHPERVPFCKPKLLVKEGGQVRRGDPVFIDKRDPRIRFLSPGGGTVERITYGPRRIVREVAIRLATGSEEEATYTACSAKGIRTLQKEELVERLLSGGVWPLFRELPFRDIPSPDTTPPMIIVQLTGGHCFSPRAEVFLEGEMQTLKAGLDALAVLTPRVVVAGAGSQVAAGMDVEVVTHRCEGAYPADDAGVVLYHIKTDADQNRAWMIRGQDLLAVGRLLTTGRYPIKRVVAVGGNLVRQPRHLETRMGAPWDLLLQNDSLPAGANPRRVTGGLFKGYDAGNASFVGFYETSLVMMETGDEDEFFGFMRPGYGKASRSRAFLSFFNRGTMPLDCSLHGEERACINCGYCLEVCPVAILPHYLMKCIHADEVDEALGLGLLDCVECGLCTYVCPSKINLCDGFARARRDYHCEMG